LFSRVEQPIAEFTGIPLVGCGPLTVNFTDASIPTEVPITAWDWNFGEGGISTNQNPTYEYDLPGVYTVSLMVTDSTGSSDTKNRVNYVLVIGPNVAFSNDVDTIPLGSSINFTDDTIISGAPIDGWTWTFGDGNTSNLKNPTHSYATTGVFDVSLNVTDLDGCSRLVVSNALITVLALDLVVAEKTAMLVNDADGDGKASPGDTLRYIISVTNTGDVDAVGVNLTDMVDSTTQNIDTNTINVVPMAADDEYTTTGGVQLAIAAPDLLDNDQDLDNQPQPLSVSAFDNPSANGGAVSVGGDGGFTFDPAAGFSGPDTFMYAATDGAATDTATVTVNVLANADLGVTKSANAETGFVGTVLTYTITITNEGPTAAASGYTVVDTLPTGVQYAASSSTPAESSLSGTGAPGDPFVLTWNLGSLAAGGSQTITVPITPSATGTVDNVVLVSHPGFDGVSGNDAAMESTEVQPSLNAPPEATNDAYDVTGNVGIDVPEGSGLLANDGDPDMDTLSVSAFDAASAQSGTVNVETNGAFTYDPSPGYTGPDSFGYTVSDGMLTDTGTVNLTVSNMIWFIDNTAGGGDGRLMSPYNNLAGFTGGASDAAGDVIYVDEGNGTIAGQNTGITLLNNQRLLGQGVDLATQSGITFPPHTRTLPAVAGNPTFGNAFGTAITLGMGNTIRGLDVTSTGGKGIVGGSVGNLTISNTTVSATGGDGLELSGGTLAAAFDSISSVNSSGEGIDLNNCIGSLTVAGDTTITSPAAQGIDIDGFGTAVDFRFGSATGSGTLRITDAGGDGINLNGVSGSFDIRSAGGGIFFNNNNDFNGIQAITLVAGLDLTVEGTGSGINRFEISGVSKGTGLADAHGIHTRSVASVTLRSVNIHDIALPNSNDSATYLENTLNSVVVGDSNFERIDEGFAVGVLNSGAPGDLTVVVSNNTFSGKGSLADPTQGGVPSEAVVVIFGSSSGAGSTTGKRVWANLSDNTFNAVGRAFGLIVEGNSGTGASGASEFTIRDNTINDLDNDGIDYAMGGSSISRWLIEDNEIDGETGVAGGAPNRGIDLVANVFSGQADVIVRDNMVYDMEDEGIRIFNFLDPGAGLIVALVDNNVLSSAAVDQGIDIDFESGNEGRITVQNNQIAYGSDSLQAITDNVGFGNGILCLSATGNSGLGGVGAPSGVFDLDDFFGPGSFTSPQANSAAMSAANNGVTVNSAGVIFGGPVCAQPTAPGPPPEAP